MRPEICTQMDPPPLDTLTELARDACSQLPPPSPAELGNEWAVVSARIATQRARRRTLVHLTAVGAFASAVVLAVAVRAPSRLSIRAATPPALSYQVEGGNLVEGGYLRESGDNGVKLRFAEGTEFMLMPGTRSRLRSVTPAGARIAIEHGTASFQVTPRTDARWLVDVGPFLVTVKGTVFTVAWDAVSERFDLKLQHGQVSVTGPVSTGEILVKAGQRLVVNLPKKETVITEAGPGGEWSDSPAEHAEGDSEGLVPAEAPSGVGGTGGRSAPFAAYRRSAEARSIIGRGWVEAVAAGAWDRVLADVDRAGVRRTLAQASSEDLLALADAARYRRRTGLARVALLAERNRFPGTRSALDAAFLLGRLEESRQGTGESIRWYDTYLAGAPKGTYASEALGRKMMVTKQLRGSADAESLAREYLRRFPTGTYAGAARALLLQP